MSSTPQGATFVTEIAPLRFPNLQELALFQFGAHSLFDWTLGLDILKDCAKHWDGKLKRLTLSTAPPADILDRLREFIEVKVGLYHVILLLQNVTRKAVGTKISFSSFLMETAMDVIDCIMKM